MTLNDRTTPLSLLETRRSGKPRDMVAPGPSPAELDRILTIAARTPDHGKLTPWRFVVIGDDQRDALADLLCKALPDTNPDAGPAHFEKARGFAHQAPSLVVLLSAPIEGHKIPVWEQQMSAGAVAMNLLHAAHALGYVGGWISGWMADSAKVTAALGEPGERIIGFFFLGSPAQPLEDRPRPDMDTLVRRWTPTG